ncbi:heterokaryon incompatibility protein-domain-containing protein [Bisporella sp. PMI_857]|nr:heterokaryon incompatibility protein-domain-containing protein [Bisporella sp. PMI_857]
MPRFTHFVALRKSAADSSTTSLSSNHFLADSSQVPEIILPDDWNVDSGTRCIWTEPGKGKCDVCGWTGQPSKIQLPSGVPNNILKLRTSGESGCIKCRLMTLMFDALHIHIGPRSDIYQTSSSEYNIRASTSSWRSMSIFTTACARPPPCGIITRSLLDQETTSQQSLQWAKNQISSCIISHEQCHITASDFLPTRLICVMPLNQDGDVVLVDGSMIPQDARYCALSYCWGGLEPGCKTTASTLADRKTCISWKSLTKTFQDAIMITRQLDVPYLWIDSMCIMQNDEADWLHEAGKMFNVYLNSFVTIGAISGKDSNAGLWGRSVDRDPNLIATLRLRGKAWPLYIRQQHLPFYEWREKSYFSSEYYPLFGRAWAYQERLISPRVLLFSDSELAFQCISKVSCQCGADNSAMAQKANRKSQFFKSLNINREEKVLSPRMIFENYDDRGDMRQIEENSLESSWRDIVTYYSGLHLSNEHDRLVAIGAVAEQVHLARLNEKYLAGLWSGSLLKDLLWQSSQVIDKVDNEPSWSWSSWKFADKDKNVSYPPSISMPDFEGLARIIEATCQYTEGNQFGVLVSSKLVLRGRLLKCRSLQQYDFPRRLIFGNWGFMKLGLGHRTFLTINTPLLSRNPWLRKFYMLEIAADAVQVSKRTIWWYLILLPSDLENKEFTRIGMATMHLGGNNHRVVRAAWRFITTRSEITTLEIV